MESSADGALPGVAEALALGERELVAFVGAGGKKTAMHALCEAGTEQNRTVGYTTTTQFPLPELSLRLVCESKLRGSIDTHLRETGSPLAFAASETANPQRAARKFRGYTPAVISQLFADGLFDWLVVKADGARRREFKAPATHEPEIPTAATVVVPVVSVQVVGEPLSESFVHRPERVAALTGLELGDSVTAEAVARVLASPEGGCKEVPPESRAVPLCNKADTAADRETAREILERACAHSDRLERGVVSSFRAGVFEQGTAF